MVHTFTLSCGMPLVVEVIPGVRSASVHWLVPAGAATDPADRQGLSAIIAELLLRGAGALDSRAQADAFDALGASRDADVGAVFQRVSATMIGDRLPGVLPLLIDMVVRPRFDEHAIEPSRELCQQSLASLADHPEERAAHILRARHLPDPLGRSGLGTKDGLAAVTRDDILTHWSDRARPAGSIMAVAGAVDPAAVVTQLNSLLSGWRGDAPPLVIGDAPATKGTYRHEREQSNQVHIYLAHDAPREADPAAPLERVLAGVLSGGPSARLFTEVRERRGLCYSVSAAYSADKHFGRLVGYVGTTPDKAQQSLDVMVGELRKVTGGGPPGARVTRDEFDRAVVGVKSALVFSGESTAARAGALASDLYRLGRARSLEEIASGIDAVTLDGLNAYAEARSPGPMTAVTLGPAELLMPAW